MAKEQSAPLVAKIKELEEERDSFRLRAQEATASAKATAGQLGAEQSEHQATKVALAEATKAAEASRVEVSAWKGKAEDLEKEASQAAEASVAAQAALDVEVREHEALRSAVRSACEALDVEEVQSASSLGSRLIALSGHVRERLRGALHTGVKRALAVVSSHYAINLEAVSDGYVLPEDDEEADAEVVRLLEAAEAPGTALHRSSCDILASAVKDWGWLSALVVVNAVMNVAGPPSGSSALTAPSLLLLESVPELLQKESVLFDLGLKLAELLQVWATIPPVDEILVPCCRGCETRRRGTTRPRPGR
ncbi:uncharacterized protein [Miscanthus floridulus]|uniref:uncharacterized protein n=1 Tax=Miscanthus floridulus TaxID=154761 RepID=UPI0034574E58